MREIWEETPRGLRAGCVALWAVGVVLLGLGWWGDSAGFWADKAFATNVFSSVTAAAFGVPLALVVLNRVAMIQAEAVEARAGRRLAMRVAGDFAASAPRLVPGPAARLDDAAAGLLAVERAAQAALKAGSRTGTTALLLSSGSNSRTGRWNTPWRSSVPR
ncbi:hypothetical protein J7F01_31115 [Streptomyces sp. ISL-22]|uniref:hypothetical protein n=1 Tax=unclassified Streptomyces TaxID=2593676 RepID=UPI001BEBD612|nr:MULTISPECIES: hypothetical protein [unclassified Streptomyces]MBT2422482.1 hypothetical protein [Streptomyces sp. ISL-24]MBT2436533.1 hypothetical protein [Streptomyces sp. ISL-22]